MSRYVSKYDSNGRVWRIVDLDHPVLKALPEDGDILDDSPAMTIIQNDAANSLVTEFRKQFPERFDVLKVGGSKEKQTDDMKWAKELIVKIVNDSENIEQLLAKSKVFEDLLKMIK